MTEIHSGRMEERVPLHSVLPLKAPFCAGISPSELCNFKCVYCNWGATVGVPGASILKWDDFMNIAEQVSNLYHKSNMKCKNMRLQGTGEPLLNSRISDMVKVITDLDFAERIEITTNASVLSHRLSEALLDAGLTRLIVSIQGVDAKRYKEISGVDIDFEKLLNELKYFYDIAQQVGGKCKVHIKSLEFAIKEDERSSFYSIFGELCDTMNVENMIAAFEDVDYLKLFPEFSMQKTRYGTPYAERTCCDTLFYNMKIRPNGDVNACGCRWPPHVIGNIYETPLDEIWNHGQHRADMITHLKGMRHTIPSCNNCSSILQYVMPEDNLDNHLDEILQRYMEV